MDDTNKTCREFVSALASSAPTPGGGGAAARRVHRQHLPPRAALSARLCAAWWPA